MKKVLALLNAMVILFVVVFNYIAGAKGFNGNTVGSVSDKYDTLFTPADYAFSIWGLIYVLLLIHAGYQIWMVFIRREYDDFVSKMGPWLIIANLANIMWLYAWLMEYIRFSVILMVVILFSLTMIVIRLNMERWDAPFKVIRNLWWPIVVYYGWITVATVANISSYLVYSGYAQSLDEVKWTVIMIAGSAAIYLLVFLLRSMREYAAVGIWAFIAIAVRHWGDIPSIQWTALGAAVLLGLVSTGHAIYHWETNPLNKMIHSKKNS